VAQHLAEGATVCAADVTPAQHAAQVLAAGGAVAGQRVALGAAQPQRARALLRAAVSWRLRGRAPPFRAQRALNSASRASMAAWQAATSSAVNTWRAGAARSGADA